MNESFPQFFLHVHQILWCMGPGGAFSLWEWLRLSCIITDAVLWQLSMASVVTSQHIVTHDQAGAGPGLTDDGELIITVTSVTLSQHWPVTRGTSGQQEEADTAQLPAHCRFGHLWLTLVDDCWLLNMLE